MSEFIHEGKVRILQKNVVGKIEPQGNATASRKRTRKEDSDRNGSNTLFYNPAQVFNRDISLIALKVFGERRLAEAFARFEGATNKLHVAEEVKGLKICEPLAATGLRSLRYATELPRSIFREVTTSDLDAFAVEQATANRTLNAVAPNKMTIVHAEATELLHCGKYICDTSSWDVIDIDPYGTASPFIEAAVAAVKDGGMLCITSTDMPVLGGNAPDVAFYKYGGCTVKARYLHEMALRLVIHQLQMTAAKYRRFILPLLSLSVDFYVRIFVQVSDRPVRCSDICSLTAIVYQCSACDFFVTAPFGTEVQKGGRAKKLRRTGRDLNTQQPDPTPPTEQDAQMNAEETLTELKAEEKTEEKTKKELTYAHLYSTTRSPETRLSLGRVPHEITGRTCPECGGVLVIGGPFYAGPLHDGPFVRSCLEEMDKAGSPVSELLMDSQKDELLASETIAIEIESGFVGIKPVSGQARNEIDKGEAMEVSESQLEWVKNAKMRFDYEMSIFRFSSLSAAVRDKIMGVLRACSEEIPEVPFFYNLSSICNHARISMIKLDKFKSALMNLGYRVGLFHREPLSIKTDAPVTAIFDIMRAWIQNSSNESSQKHTRTPPNYLAPLKLLPVDDINFSYHPQLCHRKKDQKPRWLPNPTAHWGPGRKAGVTHA